MTIFKLNQFAQLPSYMNTFLINEMKTILTEIVKAFIEIVLFEKLFLSIINRLEFNIV